MAPLIHPILARYFSSLNETDAEFLNKRLQSRQVAAGDELFCAGSEANDLYFVLEGRFAVHKTIGIGDRTQVVALLAAGTVIGERCVGHHDRLHGASVQAVLDSGVAVLTRQALVEIEQHLPLVYIGMMKTILDVTSLRLQKSSERLARVL